MTCIALLFSPVKLVSPMKAVKKACCQHHAASGANKLVDGGSVLLAAVPAMLPTMVKLPGQRSVMQLVPPPADLHNPLVTVELARSAEVSPAVPCALKTWASITFCLCATAFLGSVAPQHLRPQYAARVACTEQSAQSDGPIALS